MDNSYFLCSSGNIETSIKTFHICTWEFNSQSSLIEFGVEINQTSISSTIDKLCLEIYVPWLDKNCVTKDLYNKLKDSDVCRFIFNDSITNTSSVDGNNSSGVTHTFYSEKKLFFCPCKIRFNLDIKKIIIEIELNAYQKIKDKPNLYFRFLVEPDRANISTRKNGIAKSTIIYDFKINEKRNLPEYLVQELFTRNFCDIESCFLINIIPNRYDLTFFEDKYLKKVRTLEFDSFRKYLGDKRIKKNDLIVVSNLKIKREIPAFKSFSFFLIYTEEKIGAGQFALAIFINIICNTLLFIPSYEISLGIKGLSPMPSIIFKYFPIELDFSVFINVLIIAYFLRPYLSSFFYKLNIFGQKSHK